MRPQDLDRWLQRQPFRPFRVRVTTGQTYDIRHPEQLLMRHSSATVTLPNPEYPFLGLRREIDIALLHIVLVEEIPPTTTPEAN